GRGSLDPRITKPPRRAPARLSKCRPETAASPSTAARRTPAIPRSRDLGKAFRKARAAAAQEPAELPRPRPGGMPLTTRTSRACEIPVAARSASIAIPAVFPEKVEGMPAASAPCTVRLQDSLLKLTSVFRRDDIEQVAEGCLEVDLELSFASCRGGDRRSDHDPNHGPALRGMRPRPRGSMGSAPAAEPHPATRPAS